jgi:hypothetical protein
MHTATAPVDPQSAVPCGRPHGTTVPVGVLALAAYALLVRPRLVRWGATDDEVTAPFPGRDIMPDSVRTANLRHRVERSEVRRG